MDKEKIIQIINKPSGVNEFFNETFCLTNKGKCYKKMKFKVVGRKVFATNPWWKEIDCLEI